MEDGSSNGGVLLSENLDHFKNGDLSPVMANLPNDTTITTIFDTKQINDDLTITKINGDRNLEQIDNDIVDDDVGGDNNDNSSESDALIIDETIITKQKTKRKRTTVNKKSIKSNNNENQQHYNPYFNESLFELSQQHHQILTTATGTVITTTTTTTATNTTTPVELSTITNSLGDKNVGELTTNLSNNLNKPHKHKRLKKKNSPKLREYTQYLGLQPSVQFKCSKCARNGFQSLNQLNEHLVQCNAEPIIQQQFNDNNQSSTSSSSSFKLTRKVFLCSACGTYYENWNLYLHMIDVHRRYLCLYCLGMFSVLDDLCTHIQIKHNLEPGYKENLHEFYQTYNEPCYIVCCNCGKLFNEQDNFFYHTCNNKETITTNNNNKLNKLTNKSIKTIKQQIIETTDHITGDSIIDDNQQNINELNDDDRLTNQNEILYSSDSELDFKGFDDDGVAVILNQSNQTEKEQVEEEEEEIVDNQEEDNHDEEAEAEEEEEEDNDEDNDESGDDDESKSTKEEHIETRKVPKLSLKLKLGSFPEIEQHSNDDDDDDDDDDEEDDDDDQQNTIESDKNEEVEDNQIVNNNKEEEEEVEVEENKQEKDEFDEIQIAGPEIPIVELQLEQPLDKFDIRLLIQKCLNATSSTCIYCNHARKIFVNGKRLGLHAIAQHRYSAIVSSITAEELLPETFIQRIKENLINLDNIYFNLESNPTRTDEGVTFSHIFECFQCRYSTTIHKELYLHNRKSHAKNLLLCIMCKLNFYSYSELICHLCPGAYIIDYDVQYRCCMCVSDDIPSAFRLMVHLRKRHHVCDVCLEICHNQYKLSNHVWKHKLHHFCYRCGIAYRNKPDITRHLFWKHGTESVLCKKCLQKKWPHVYHFCVPPNSFLCDECNTTYSNAIALKVHKRIHNNDRPHCCTIDDCHERFISKKLLAKHELRHREPPPEEIIQQTTQQQIEENNEPIQDETNQNDQIPEDNEEKQQLVEEEMKEKPVQKPKIDVYDLPELNLSESDSSDSEVETQKKIDENQTNIEEIHNENDPDDRDHDENKESIIENYGNDNEIPILEEPVPIIDDDADGGGNNVSTDVVIENIWDNFKNYQASKEKFDNLLTEVESKFDQTTSQQQQQQNDQEQEQQEQNKEPLTLEMALLDHDYCIDPDNKPDISFTEVKPDLSQSVDHDYCFGKNTNDTKETTTTIEDKKDDDKTAVVANTTTTTITTPTTITTTVDENVKNTPQKHQSNSSSSDSSSDSDSSSCSCGPNCSCSSSSDSSSSTSDSSNSDSSTEEGRKRQQLRREKRRQRANTNKKSNAKKNDENKIIDIMTTATTTTITPTITTTTTTTTNKTNSLLLLNELPLRESDLETTESETDEEFYDKQPHLIAKKILEEKRNQLLAGIESITTPNGSLLEQPSRSTTPNLPVEVEQDEETTRSKKKSKSKKKKKKKKSENNREFQSNIPNSNYYQYYQQQQQSQTVAPITLSLNRNSPIPSPSTPLYTKMNNDSLTHHHQRGGGGGGSGDDDANLRASKRRRVPNKFYGYSSDEDEMPKWRKTDLSQIPPQQQQFVVPPITIKTQGIQPFSVSKTTPNQMKFHSKQSQLQQYYQHCQQQQQQQRMPPIRLKQPKNHQLDDDGGGDSEQESNDSTSGESRNVLKVNPSALYCYCKCPYDEVSEMIGCDAPDCKIEWFHFECVGIMVPPKGHWYCPECRKKRQQKREALKLKAKQVQQQQQQSPT